MIQLCVLAFHHPCFIFFWLFWDPWESKERNENNQIARLSFAESVGPINNKHKISDHLCDLCIICAMGLPIWICRASSKNQCSEWVATSVKLIKFQKQVFCCHNVKPSNAVIIKGGDTLVESSPLFPFNHASLVVKYLSKLKLKFSVNLFFGLKLPFECSKRFLWTRGHNILA